MNDTHSVFARTHGGWFSELPIKLAISVATQTFDLKVLSYAVSLQHCSICGRKMAARVM